MLTPFVKSAVVRTALEGMGLVGFVALTMTTEEAGLALTVAVAAVGVIVWLVRLEGRVNTLLHVGDTRHESNVNRLEDITDRLVRIADRIGVD